MIDTTSRAFASPLRYIQGRGEFERFEEHTRELGNRVFFLIDPFLYESLSVRMQSVYHGTDSEITTTAFGGEATYQEAERLIDAVRAAEANVIVAMGGGKTMDTGKLIAIKMGLPMVMAPTSISTDAPTSAVSMMYTETGESAGACPHDRHPDLVLVDSQVVSQAPLRLTRAGMADALATYIEAAANARSDNYNYIDCKYRRTVAGMHIARAAYDTILASGRRAFLSARAGVCSAALEDIIEANTLLSGLGFENCGSAGAHLLAGALTTIPEAHKFLHGELVSFGIVFQLMLENAPQEDVNVILELLTDLELPVTLEQIGLDNAPECIAGILNAVLLSPDSFAEPFLIEPEDISAALIMADAVGKEFLNKKRQGGIVCG